jgi:galactitol PTS system EIIB component
MGRLIIVACGAGINTSTVAEDAISDRMKAEGFNDITVKRILMADIDGYLDRDDLVLIVSMMKVYREFPVPVVKGMPFLIGTKADKEESLDEIVKLISE